MCICNLSTCMIACTKHPLQSHVFDQWLQSTPQQKMSWKWMKNGFLSCHETQTFAHLSISWYSAWPCLPGWCRGPPPPACHWPLCPLHVGRWCRCGCCYCCWCWLGGQMAWCALPHTLPSPALFPRIGFCTCNTGYFTLRTAQCNKCLLKQSQNIAKHTDTRDITIWN